MAKDNETKEENRKLGVRPRRPRDPNQLGKLIVELSVGEAEEIDPPISNKDPAAASLGRKGGAARAKAITPERRAEIARNAAQKRWSKASN